MNKEKFIKAIKPYLIPGAEEKREEIEIDNYTVYIKLDKNKLSISVLNNATNRNIDLSSNKYRSYIKPILNASEKEGNRKEGINHIFILKNTTEYTTEDIKNVKKRIYREDNNLTDNIDMNKLNLLIDNYDKIMNLINTTVDTTKNTTNKKIDLSTKNTKVTSIRLNKDLHRELKKKAEEEECNFGELINKVLYKYLNKKDYL